MADFLPASWAPIALLALLFVLRFAAHSGGSDFEARKGERSWTTIAFVVSHISMAGLAVTGGWMGWHELSIPVSVAGMVLMSSGIALTRISRRTLAQHFSIFLKADDDHELITTGVYSKVRHPLYTAELLIDLGAPLVTCTPEALVFLPLVFVLVQLRIRTEEKLLHERYPEYAAYVARTRALI